MMPPGLYDPEAPAPAPYKFRYMDVRTSVIFFL